MGYRHARNPKLSDGGERPSTCTVGERLRQEQGRDSRSRVLRRMVRRCEFHGLVLTDEGG